MKILVVAATEAEIGSLMADLENSVPGRVVKPESATPGTYKTGNPTSGISFLITGVGMVATAFALGRHLALYSYDLVINLGIAGSFDKQVPLGSVIEITEDTIAELGAENDLDFLPLSKLGFGEESFKASARLADYYSLSDISQATAITVNAVHGEEASIQRVVDRLNPQMESMEGAAVFYACREAATACLQIRAVSNYIEKRNRAGWQAGLAIKNLNTFAGKLLKDLTAGR